MSIAIDITLQSMNRPLRRRLFPPVLPFRKKFQKGNWNYFFFNIFTTLLRSGQIGKAPDSGSGNSRFESWLLSKKRHGNRPCLFFCQKPPFSHPRRNAPGEDKKKETELTFCLPKRPEDRKLISCQLQVLQVLQQALLRQLQVLQVLLHQQALLPQLQVLQVLQVQLLSLRSLRKRLS